MYFWFENAFAFKEFDVKNLKKIEKNQKLSIKFIFTVFFSFSGTITDATIVGSDKIESK